MTHNLVKHHEKEKIKVNSI